MFKLMKKSVHLPVLDLVLNVLLEALDYVQNVKLVLHLMESQPVI